MTGASRALSSGGVLLVCKFWRGVASATMVHTSAMWGLACSQVRENPITTREAVAMAPSQSLDAPRSHSMTSTRSRYLLAARVRVCHRHHGRREELLASEEQVQGLRGRPAVLAAPPQSLPVQTLLSRLCC